MRIQSIRKQWPLAAFGGCLAAGALAELWMWSSWLQSANEQQVIEASRQVTAQLWSSYGSGAAGLLLRCPLPIVSVTITVVLLVPFLAVVRGMTAHSVPAREHRVSVALITWLMLALTLLVPFAVTSIGALGIDRYSVDEALTWGASLWLRCAIYALPFVCLGVVLRRAVRPVWLRWAAAALVLLLLALARGHAEGIGAPAQQLFQLDRLLLAYSRAEQLKGLALATAWSLALLMSVPVLGFVRAAMLKSRREERSVAW